MISENILYIKGCIARAAKRVKRDAAGITIVAISKGRSTQQIWQAIEAGITDIGENRVQEAVVKYNDLRYAISNKPICWHMVGHLQTNKAKEAMKVFDLIQSVDSLHLAQAISKHAKNFGKVQDVLIEVKTSPEATKFGLLPEEALKVIPEIVKLKNLNVKGLMTIAPLVTNSEEARPYFRVLRELRDSIIHLPFAISHLPVLSMGMTDDFEVAIEEGATMVRLGRAIFA
ncbi:MAG: YggS family pyridoxal phosphate-dependent enzyme [Candidatus Omnitrophota bacterium]